MAAAAEIVDLDQHRKRQSCGEKPNVSPKRKYLWPDEVRRVIDAAGRLGRNRERDQLVLTMMYRHGLRVGEAVDLRWTDFDLDASRDRPFWVRRLKDGKNTMHTLEPDTARLLIRAKKCADGIYVFRSERGRRLSDDIVRLVCERAGYAAGFGFRVRPHMFRHAAGFALSRGGDGYTPDPGLPGPPGHQEHGRLHRDLAATAGGRAGPIKERGLIARLDE